MNFEEIKERYLAGETDLKAETKFLFDTQGSQAAFDFARTLDEEIGSEPYLKVIRYIEELEADQLKPKENEAEKQRKALEMAQKMAKKAADSAENKAIAIGSTIVKNAALPDVAIEVKQPLFPKSNIINEVGAGGKIGGVKPAEMPKAEDKETDSNVFIYAVLALILIYFIVK